MLVHARPVLVASSLLLSATALLGGCGGADTLDSPKLERDLKASLEATIDAKIGPVKCPDDIEIEKGSRTICTTTNPGGDTVRIEVTQTDGDGKVKYVVR